MKEEIRVEMGPINRERSVCVEGEKMQASGDVVDRAYKNLGMMEN